MIVCATVFSILAPVTIKGDGMHIPSIIVGACLLGSAVSAMASADEPPLAVVPPSEIAIRSRIENNWNVDTQAIEACQQPIKLRVHLNEDGTVAGTEVVAGDDGTAACRSIIDSGQRAVLAASPLKMPAGSYISSLILLFDPKEFRP
jgi:hypothetical protein